MRFLFRLGQHVAQRKIEVLAFVFPALAPKHRQAGLDRVFPHRALVAKAPLERMQLRHRCRLADAEFDASVAQEIERRDALRDARRVIGGEPPINIEFEFWNCVTDKEINLSLHLFTNTEECVFASATNLRKIPVGLQKTICEIPANLLNDGIYQVSIMIVYDSAPLYNFENMVSFEINEKRQASGWHGKWPGIIRPKLNFKFINE